jgi:hypothetical protein
MNMKLKAELPRGRLRWEQQGRKDFIQKEGREEEHGK